MLSIDFFSARSSPFTVHTGRPLPHYISGWLRSQVRMCKAAMCSIFLYTWLYILGLGEESCTARGVKRCKVPAVWK